ncbi:hypothetical protein FISHEDRAFT_34988 [Fistulina hepatica ATCC 64428]|uniref:Uncharacterized protein n=1 Tax=Fistulina hepatica ATCC 64428 TaxID=1128425 RepID=A0A0D7ALU6_9AGAR|nr:hypothetical protein FISHEDRAFT_34988 [Fistulina hepatica ATCC 64428]
MRGVSMPTHQYARVAESYNQAQKQPSRERNAALIQEVRSLAAATRAYTRVVLRLRAQAERQATASRLMSATNSPTQSTFSHGTSQLGHSGRQPMPPFQSPLFRPRRAPLLRVFVPSPEGDWLADASVIECEAELRRAGVMDLFRMGDVVWDVAVGDEGNVGRLIWDGSYLLDLDYTYSSIGDLPKYIPALSFSPSYFHRIIRTGPTSSNPIVHMDISPWGEEIASNLQLLQDRARTETPQGAHHNVVRWVHRSSFKLKPKAITSTRNSVHPAARAAGTSPRHERIPVPGFQGVFVDSGWYGTIVVEAEGTNEGLADLQDRCGPGVFPARATGSSALHSTVKGVNFEDKAAEARKVFRIMREKSRPGEIWLHAVSAKDRIL